MKKLISIFAFTLFLINVNGQNSPCPDIFQFYQDGNRKYGIITIPGPGEGKTVVQASIGIHGTIYDSNSGGLGLRKSLEQSVADARQGKDVQYTFNFPRSEQWPIVSKIELNYRPICTGPETSNVPTWSYEHSFTYPAGSTQLSSPLQPRPVQPVQEPRPRPQYPTLPEPRPVERPTPSRPVPQPVPQAPVSSPVQSPSRPAGSSGPATPNDSKWLSTLQYASVCGKRDNFAPSSQRGTVPLIINGLPVDSGEYPWMVAMYRLDRGKIVYICGATLITDKHAITAAHCMSSNEQVLLIFGKLDLSRNEEGAITRIARTVRHPDYLVDTAQGDIAVVTFDPVEFTSKIKPICLWPFGTVFDTARRNGTVTGWGKVEQDGESSSVPTQAQVTRTDLTTCRNSHTALRALATDRTFCAGGQNQGPCLGDSGSGFYTRHQNTFYLRGIISVSLSRNRIACLIENYAVYVDIIYYLDWIRQQIE